MSELVGRFNKQQEELKAIKNQAYETVMGIITMCETASSLSESGKHKEAAAYFKHIVDKCNYLKGYAE